MNTLQSDQTASTLKQPSAPSLFGSPQWENVKTEIIALWSSVNGDELDRTRGNLKEIANLIHNKYGAAKKAVMAKVSDVYRKYEGSSPPAYAGARA